MRAIRQWFYRIGMLEGILSFAFPGNGQQTEALQYRILTDRSVYIVGEDVGFRVFNLSSESLRELGLSRVYYLEFISPDGDPYVQMKLPLDTLGTAGGFRIPPEIPSGTYYLKGYTRYLRNLGPAAYSYLSITVINPFLKTVLSVDTTSVFTVPLIQQDWGCSGPDTPGTSGNGTYPPRTRVPPGLQPGLQPEPKPGRQPGLQPEPFKAVGEACMTVARPGALTGQWEFSMPVSPSRHQDLKVIPETRGITLTGRVTSAGSEEPVPYAEVFVTSMEGDKEFKCQYTDSLGYFYIVLEDRVGTNELYVSASHPVSGRLDISIERDFCQVPLKLPSFPLSLETMGENLVSELSVNAQIRARYETGTGQVADTTQADKGSYFYGEPSVSIRLSDFINLPALEEYIGEVIPQVAIRNSGGHRKFRVLGSNPDLQFFEPLMMVDGVAVFEIESILAISPRYVEKIEVVTEPYIRGVMTFGGIINLVTKEGNMGYMDLPDSGILLSYQMYSKAPVSFSEAVPGDPRLPDVRNTLYWEPMVGSQKRVAGPGFYTSDAGGAYCILIRGYDREGHFLQRSEPLLVQ